MQQSPHRICLYLVDAPCLCRKRSEHQDESDRREPDAKITHPGARRLDDPPVETDETDETAKPHDLTELPAPKKTSDGYNRAPN